MITIVYAPDGFAIPDVNVQYECESIQRLCAIGEINNVRYSTENVIQELLTWIAEEKISIDDIQFMFNDKVLDVSRYGRVADWPTGFADNTWNTSQRRLMAQVVRRKKEKAWLQNQSQS